MKNYRPLAKAKESAQLAQHLEQWVAHNGPINTSAIERRGDFTLTPAQLESVGVPRKRAAAVNAYGQITTAAVAKMIGLGRTQTASWARRLGFVTTPLHKGLAIHWTTATAKAFAAAMAARKETRGRPSTRRPRNAR